MVKTSSSFMPLPSIYGCALLAALVGAGCGMRTDMEAAEGEGEGIDPGGAGAGGSKAGGGASGSGIGSKPASSKAGSATAGALAGGNSQAGVGGAAAGSPGGSPAGGSATSGNAGSRAGAGSIAFAGSSGRASTSSAGSKAGASGSITGGSSAGGGSVTGGSKSSSSSGKRDAGTLDTRLSTDANTTTPPKINTNSGYATVPAGTVIMNGYVSSYVGGSGSSISLDYTETSFCASGKVGASSTYNSWAGAGFNVNQTQSGSGSTGSLKIEGSSISISYENKKDSRLELQLWDGSNYWCTYLPSAKGPTTYTVPLSNLNTKCWDGSGTPFKSGTSITTVQLVTPGSATSATPFDYCFLGISIQ